MRDTTPSTSGSYRSLATVAFVAAVMASTLVACASRVGHPLAPDMDNSQLSERDRGTFATTVSAEYDPLLDVTVLNIGSEVKGFWVGLWMQVHGVDDALEHFTVKAVDVESGLIVVRGDATLAATPGGSFRLMDTRAYVVSPSGAALAGPVSTATVEQLQEQLEQQLEYFSEYRLQYGDRFRVLLLSHPEWTTNVQVLRDGNIYFGFYSGPDEDEDDGSGEDNGSDDGDGSDDGSGDGTDEGSDDGASDGGTDPEIPTPGRAMHVVGKTIADVQAMLITALRQYFVDPQIKIEEIEQAPTSWTVKVIGAVNKPGRVQVLAGHRVLDAIADAGGEVTRQFVNNISDLQPLLPLVDWRAATLSRESAFLPAGTAPANSRPTDLCRLDMDFVRLMSGDNDYNIPLFPGDVIQIPAYEAQNTRVTVAGRVGIPGVYYFREQIDLMEALARAGWLVEDDASFGGVYLVRNSIAPDGQRESYVLNPINVARGSARNIPLRDGDIVYVDSSTLHDVANVADKIGSILFSSNHVPNGGNEWRNLFR